MEVHAHTHTARKKWTHYFWEFLMLFLAVFCGFLAENEREHFVEHQREKQYIRSLISDVKTDTANITQWMASFSNRQKSCDTVLDNFDSFSKNYSIKTGKNYFSVISGFADFIYTDRTMQQLKNSGGMRLIRNTDATDSIIAYDASVRDILIEETGISMYYDQLNDLTNKMLSYQKFTSERKIKTWEEIEKQKINFWIKQDEREFEHLYNLLYNYRNIVAGYNMQLSKLKNRGARLLDFLQKEYNIK
jgi:hypothetical protein